MSVETLSFPQNNAFTFTKNPLKSTQCGPLFKHFCFYGQLNKLNCVIKHNSHKPALYRAPHQGSGAGRGTARAGTQRGWSGRAGRRCVW